MRPRAALIKLQPLLILPSFTSVDARARGVSSALLARYITVGELVRIGHGVYRKSDRPMGEDFRWEDLVEAVQRSKRGIVCLISALALYELTEELPRQHWIAIDHGTRHRADKSVKIIRMRNTKLGKTTFKINGVELPIFDRERTIVDSFRYLSRESAIKALRSSLKGRNKVDVKKIRAYAKKLRFNIEPYLLSETTI